MLMYHDMMIEPAWLGGLAFVLAWFIAQLTKTIIGIARGEAKKEVTGVTSFLNFFGRSGGMPSGHAASFTAMTTFLGCAYGFTSGYFIICACMWTIIVYDATHVRYAVGEQGKALNKLLEQKSLPVLPIVEGHTLLQVAAGVIIGIIVGLLVYGSWYFSLT